MTRWLWRSEKTIDAINHTIAAVLSQNVRSVRGTARWWSWMAAIAALLTCTLRDAAHAQQCLPGRWIVDGSLTGTNGRVEAMALLPGGALVAGGTFTVADGGAANRIARRDGSAWSSLGGGMNGTVSALIVLPQGDLIAGGEFTIAGGVIVNNIARWNGTAWSSLGTGTNGSVRALAVLPDGDLVAGGTFTTANGISTRRVARWNGSTWLPLGTGISADGGVSSMAVLPDGTLIVGGSFTVAGSVTANRIARWNGTSWSVMGTGMNGPVEAIAVTPNGDLIAGGGFLTAGGVPARSIARWNGSSWSAMGTGTHDGDVQALAVLADGSIFAGGSFTSMGGIPNTRKIACWVNATWVPVMGGSTNTITAITPSPSGGFDAGTAREVITFDRLSFVAPQDQTSVEGAAVTFTVRVNGCSDSITYRWQRRNTAVEDPNSPQAWFDLADDDTFANTDRASMSVLRPIPALATGYRCRIGSGCGCEPGQGMTVYTDIVNFSVACPADFNADGGIDFGDLEAFFERWENGC